MSSDLVSQILNIFLLLATIVSAFLGILVWWLNKRSSLNIIFSLFALSITIWLSGAYMMLRSCGIDKFYKNNNYYKMKVRISISYFNMAVINRSAE